MAKLDLNNKKIVISGFSSGIGKEITKILVEKYNCQIYGIARDENKIISFIKTLKNPDNIYNYSLFDVSDEDSWIALAEKLKEIGFLPDMLINCAGILPKFSSFENSSSKELKRVLEVNFLSCVYSASHLLPLIKKSKNASFVNVSSSASLVTFAGISGYSASKSALKSFSMCLSAEMGKSVYVGCICPGFTNTDIFRNQSGSEKDFKLIKRLSTSPQKVAKKTVKAIIKKKKLKVIGYDARLMSFFYKLCPNLTSKIITKILKKSGLKIFSNV